MGNSCGGNSREVWKERVSDHETTHNPPKGIGKVFCTNEPKKEATVINT
jgi:hypothetical protein